MNTPPRGGLTPVVIVMVAVRMQWEALPKLSLVIDLFNRAMI
jgi:hypothetical protein